MHKTDIGSKKEKRVSIGGNMDQLLLKIVMGRNVDQDMGEGTLLIISFPARFKSTNPPPPLLPQGHSKAD